MKIFSFIFVLCFFVSFSFSQNYQTVEDLDDFCAQLGFVSNEEAEIAVDKILTEFGLFRNFIIQECPDINNAVAKVVQISEGYKERYILYDNSFFDNMNNKAESDWASISILAHEIGHHLNGHSLNDEGSNHKFELEADFFSGSAMAKLGASLSEAQSAIMTLRYEKASRTHPAKADRLDAIANGWNQANSGENVIVENIEEANIVVFPVDENKFDSYWELASKAYSNKNYIEAAKHFISAFQYSNGKNFDSLYNAASCYITEKKYDEALIYYLAIVRNGFGELDDSKKTEIYKNIGLIYNMQGRSNEAIQFFDFALRDNPKDIDLLIARANVYYKLGKQDQFIRELTRIEQLAPNNEHVLFNLGVISFESGDMEEASHYYDKVLVINPNNVNTLINRAVILLNEENRIVQEMNNLGTSKVDDLRYDALKEQRFQLYKDATVYLEHVIALDASNTSIINTLYNIYSALNDEFNKNRIERLKK